MNHESGARKALLFIVLVIALAFRLHNVGFGLPSLYDPDEPIFMVTAAKLLSHRTLNPGWFGHPGSTTVYLIALIDIGVFGFGRLTGHFSGIGDFIQAAYADPGLLFLPARVAFALMGTACVGLTYLVARRLHGTAVGLIAAGLLAINSLHIAWSQVIRTDVHASVFMLAALLFAISIAEDGKLKHYLAAGLFTGFAIATKWPAVTIFVAVIGASIYRLTLPSAPMKKTVLLLFAAGGAVIVGTFVASPYLFLDWHGVLRDVAGEERPVHLGHTGAGFIANLGWYLRVQVAGSMGWTGLLLAIAGFVIALIRFPISRVTLLPAAVAFLVIICVQHLIWSRWLVPIIPFLCIFAALAVVAIGEFLIKRFGLTRRRLLLALLAAGAALPSLSGAVAQARERSNDTRAQAAQWVVDHVPPGRTIVLEHLELKLRQRPLHFRFPVGEAGCVDAEQLLTRGIAYDEVRHLRKGSAIVDLGTISPEKIASCRADYAILVYYDLYRTEARQFPAELAVYDQLLADGHTVALFRPVPGQSGGPVTRIVALAPQKLPPAR